MTFVCIVTIVVNLTRLPWNQHDSEVLGRAKARCVEHYPDAPCLKRFEKVGNRDYHAICGKEKR